MVMGESVVAFFKVSTWQQGDTADPSSLTMFSEQEGTVGPVPVLVKSSGTISVPLMFVCKA